MMPPKSATVRASFSSMLTAKNSFEKASTSNLMFLASKNAAISANDNLQFFPGMNTLVGSEVSILPQVKTVVKIYKRIILFPTEHCCSPQGLPTKRLQTELQIV